MKESITIIAWLLSAFIMYLICSLAVSIIGDTSYRSVLCSDKQILAVLFVYSWLPSVFIASEVYDRYEED